MARSLGLAAALLGSLSNAVLIAPGINVVHSDIKHEAAIASLGITDPFTQFFKVPCPNCMYAQPNVNDGFIWTKGVENELLLNISVGAKPDTLLLNDVQFYPPPIIIPFSPIDPLIPQVPAGLSLSEIREHPSKYLVRPLRLTGWALEATTTRATDGTDQEMVQINLGLHSLEQRPIHVPDVLITALKTKAGELILLKTDIQARLETTAAVDGPDCNGWPPLICKWRAIVSAQLARMHGKMSGKCHKLPHGAPIPVTVGTAPAQPVADDGSTHRGKYHHGRPHPHHHEGGRHHVRMRIHHFLHSVARVVIQVGIPILMGIAAGAITYSIGMMLGTAVAYVWVRMRGCKTCETRRDRRVWWVWRARTVRRDGYDAVPAAEEGIDAVAEDEPERRESCEKEGLLDVDAELEGEAPPVYAEIEGKEVGGE